ncbi:glycosyltransferase family 4 protein [Persicobacter sp. CCB-QB2]|uniref:glycosyltransferase family 4 protein n=1 Tax=Persicobacter sp. CCB-QB2 TaxID=1561025 RepID=UPI0006A9595D|nr:glycosyltransferase family 4 protein [Persicobacter sp. CCB-QB2]
MNILVIGHEASRTGAPILLEHWCRWIKTNTKHDIRILLINGGEIEPEYQEIASCQVLKKNLYGKWMPKFFRRKKLEYSNVKLEDDHFQPDIIYANTSASSHISSQLKEKYQVPCITHIHELEKIIDKLGNKMWVDNLKTTDIFIVVSKAVKQNLIQNRNVPEQKIRLHYGMSDLINFKRQKLNISEKNQLKKELGIAENALLVGASGTIIKRKGYDWFIKTAALCKVKYPDLNISFLWVGGDEKKLHKLKKDHTATLAEADITFIPNTASPQKYYSLFDVFYMCSIEDPFPLVVLENAALGNPTVCYQNAGGIPEFVKEDAGFSVPFTDVEAAADKFALFYNDRSLLASMGKTAENRALTNHNIEKISSEIMETLEETLKSQTSCKG